MQLNKKKKKKKKKKKMDREFWHAALHGFAKSQTQWYD